MGEKELQRKKTLEMPEIHHIDSPVLSIICPLPASYMHIKMCASLFVRQQHSHKELVRDVVIGTNKSMLHKEKISHISDLQSTHVSIWGTSFLASVYAYL